MSDEFLIQLQRTVDRLRIMSASQLERNTAKGDILALINNWANATRPGVQVPGVNTSALGDQLAVIGREFWAIASDSDRESAASELVAIRRNL